MKATLLISTLVTLLTSTAVAQRFTTHRNYSSPIPERQLAFSVFGDRPADCPPCFNCNLEDFQCHQFANCSAASGRCVCPAGWGGEDCTEPLCGSLAKGKDRAPRKGAQCDCDEGWSGINCNVCETNQACNALMPEGQGGVCHKQGLVVKENFQQCDVTNKQILEQLKEQKPQVTFSCNAEAHECNFQFWVDQKESFYCGLNNCEYSTDNTPDKNVTKYECEHIDCRCVPGRMLCGEAGSIDLGDFLKEEIKGPATFTTTRTEGGSAEDGSIFSEPAMNDLIQSVFRDHAIFLTCDAGECLYETEVPGYERPVKKINTPLIAGVIAGCALFIVAVILLVWYLSRRSTGYSPIALADDDDDEQAKLMADHKPATLYFRNVSYRLKGKQILADISGAVHPGELMAIMGASGAGKTSFLDLLARKNKRGDVSGEFLVNGEKVPTEEFRSVIGFVDQDDTLLPTLTVHETILDSALLRLPKDMSYAAKLQRVEDVERQLGIHHIRNQVIGSEEGAGRGISGGEKRRVGIACELVTSPSILFCDEPTSGLDAYNAFNVVECLVNLVKTYNRTVVITIHQPRSNIVALFDQLVLLAKGRTVYSGSFANCQSYFDSIGFSCPPGFNIADYLVDLTMHASSSHPPMDDEELARDSMDDQGARTRASSTVAIKSIASTSGLSTGRDSADTAGPPAEGGFRPKTTRKISVKQAQEEALFTRRTPSYTANMVPESIRSEDGSSMPDPSTDHTQQWLRLSRKAQTSPQRSDMGDDITLTGTNLDLLTAAYSNSDVAQQISEDTTAAVNSASRANGQSSLHMNGNASKDTAMRGYEKPNIFSQYLILSRRTWRNLYRNPQLLLTHYAIAIVLAVFLGFLFFSLTDDIKGFQNRLGLFFFLLALFGFSTLSTLTVFAPERLLFLRERAKGYYHPVSYYFAKVTFDIIPLRLIPPLIMGAIVYPMTGLIAAWPNFLRFILFLVLFNLAAAAICLFIGIVVKNPGVANLLGSLVMLFSLLFSGFLLNRESIPKGLGWLQSVSFNVFISLWYNY